MTSTLTRFPGVSDDYACLLNKRGGAHYRGLEGNLTLTRSTLKKIRLENNILTLNQIFS